PGNDLAQLRLFADYASNLPLYPKLHAYLRDSQVPLLAVWGATTRSSYPKALSRLPMMPPAPRSASSTAATSCSKAISKPPQAPSVASSKGHCHDRHLPHPPDAAHRRRRAAD